LERKNYLRLKQNKKQILPFNSLEYKKLYSKMFCLFYRSFFKHKNQRILDKNRKSVYLLRCNRLEQKQCKKFYKTFTK